MSQPSTTTRRFTVDEYERMAEAGVLGDDERLELLDGEITLMAAQLTPHAVAIGLAQEALGRAFGRGHWVRVQMPLRFTGARSMPEPDLAIVGGGPRDYLRTHPAEAMLVVEVADSTLEKDRELKGPICATAGVRDYWIVNLVDGVLEVYRRPRRRAYGAVATLRKGDRIAPLAAPRRAVVVEDLLPF